MSIQIDMEDRAVVITGGAQGIGAAIAEKYVRAGARAVILDVRPEGQVKEFLESLEKFGKRPLYYQCDISDRKTAETVFSKIGEECGRIDVLVNNAGIVADWDKSFAVNAKGTYYCSEEAKPWLERSKGNIVILTSASVFTGGTGIPQYNVTKAGAYALTMFLAREYAKLGIRVNGIAPAVIMSKMLVDRFGSEEAVHEHYRNVMPLGKIGQPEDIANIVLFLSSDLASYLCGQVLIADGGRMQIG